MERIGFRLVVTIVLCLAACLTGVASARAAGGGETIAQAPGVNATNRGSLYDSNFYSGFSAAFWVAQLDEGDHISIKTRAQRGVTPPCQILYMPGTDDSNVGATTPILDPASATRDGSVDGQRWVATETGPYVLAMTNADIFLSGPHQCLDAPSGKPFTFTVTVSHEGGGQQSGSGDGGGGVSSSGGGSTHVVKPGQSLWVIAQGVVGRPASIAEIAFEVGRLWRLNAVRIGTGDPDLIYPGQQLRLR